MLHVNIDEGNRRRYDATQMVHREPSKDLQSTHQYAVYILQRQVQVQMSSL